MSEPKCVTHFTGCACSEARWQRQLEAVTRERDEARADLDEINADKRRLAREIDVAMHGEDGAAKQASLCDLIHPARDLRAHLAQAREALIEIAAFDFLNNASQWPSMKIARAALERMGASKGEGRGGC